MTMLENVAHALWLKARERDSLREEQFFLEDARAAIEAMREPTEAMVKATDVVDSNGDYLCSIQDPELAWQAMIEAALAEAPA